MRMAGGARRHFKVFAALSLTMALGACGGVSSNMLPAENLTATSFTSYEAVEAAYDKVEPGETDTHGLAQLGFDPATAPNFERLSYLTVLKRFIREGAVDYENLAPPVQKCIDAQDRCSVLVFYPERAHSQRTGGVVTDLLGFERVTHNNGWSAEVTFLMLDQTVVYKVIQGKPKSQEVDDLVQPLGPATNLGSVVVHAAKSVAKY
jgi:hypothetical protein